MSADRLCIVCEQPMPLLAHIRRMYCSDRCATAARSKHTKACVACGVHFVSFKTSTLTCGKSQCRYELRYNAGKKQKTKARAASGHLDGVPNPFAGALTAKERAILVDKLQFIRALAQQGGRVGSDTTTRIRR